MNSVKLVPMILLMILFVAILGYISFRFYAVWVGPDFTIVSPQDGQTITKEKILVELKTKRVSQAYINDQKVSVSPEGVVLEEIYLSEGINPISVLVEDIHSATKKGSIFVIKK